MTILTSGLGEGARSIREASDWFRTLVGSSDAAAQEAVARAWRVADAAIQVKQDAFLAKVAAAQAAGTPITENWLYQVARLDQLRAYAAAQYTALGVQVDRAVTSAQREGVTNGIQATQDWLEVAFGNTSAIGGMDFAHLDVSRTLNSLVGTLQTGSPLRDLTFSNLTVAGAESMARALVAGLTTGESFRKVAERVNLERNMTRARAMTITRTEILRANRSAVMSVLDENARLLKGWAWSAKLDGRTCGICVANQGEVFPPGTPFESHPNCRCAPVPVTKSWAELGYPEVPETTVQLPSAKSWLDSLPMSQLRRLYGPTRAELIRSGYIRPSDLVTSVRRGAWGKQPTLTSVGLVEQIARDRGWKPPEPVIQQAAPMAEPVGWHPVATSPTGYPLRATPGQSVSEAFASSLKGMKTGSKVTDAYWAKIRAPLQHALDLLDSMMTDGRLPELLVGKLTGGDPSVQGAYRHTPSQSVDIRFRQSPTADTYVHEIGHFMDHMGTGASDVGAMASELGWNPGKYLNSTSAPELHALADLYGGWASAIRGSGEWSKLTGLLEPGATLKMVTDAGVTFDGPANSAVRAYVRYATDPRELFARSWSQYVAQRTQDPAMLAYINSAVARNNLQFWSWDDFAPIAASLDTIMEGLGWNK